MCLRVHTAGDHPEALSASLLSVGGGEEDLLFVFVFSIALSSEKREREGEEKESVFPVP